MGGEDTLERVQALADCNRRQTFVRSYEGKDTRTRAHTSLFLGKCPSLFSTLPSGFVSRSRSCSRSALKTRGKCFNFSWPKVRETIPYCSWLPASTDGRSRANCAQLIGHPSGGGRRARRNFPTNRRMEALLTSQPDVGCRWSRATLMQNKMDH